MYTQLAVNQPPFPALARDDHSQYTVQTTPTNEVVTSDTEQPLDDQDSDSDIGDDTPDIDMTDVTWMAPGPTHANNARTNVVTRARGRQNGIIHTALLFKYLDINNQRSQVQSSQLLPILYSF